MSFTVQTSNVKIVYWFHGTNYCTLQFRGVLTNCFSGFAEWSRRSSPPPVSISTTSGLHAPANARKHQPYPDPIISNASPMPTQLPSSPQLVPLPQTLLLLHLLYTVTVRGRRSHPQATTLSYLAAAAAAAAADPPTASASAALSRWRARDCPPDGVCKISRIKDPSLGIQAPNAVDDTGSAGAEPAVAEASQAEHETEAGYKAAARGRRGGRNSIKSKHHCA